MGGPSTTFINNVNDWDMLWKKSVLSISLVTHKSCAFHKLCPLHVDLAQLSCQGKASGAVRRLDQEVAHLIKMGMTIDPFTQDILMSQGIPHTKYFI